jgi:hypothetical protein
MISRSDVSIVELEVTLLEGDLGGLHTMGAARFLRWGSPVNEYYSFNRAWVWNPLAASVELHLGNLLSKSLL